ncbi:MAG: PAS domain S-box protein [Bacteroidales bacterium]|jgi:PAS domain S-box-containing protein|nr:PAS domain S-box protein [Bacteroidales bacterium]
MSAFNVLIVEDELIISKLLQNYLNKMGHNVVSNVPSGEEAISFIQDNSPDLILMDIELAGMLNGIETTEIIRQTKDIPTLFLTSLTDKYLLEKAKAVDPVGYLLKPVQPIQLEIIIEMTRKKIQVDLELENYRKHLERLIVDRTKGLVKEIEEHKKALKKIEENEIRLSLITSSANDAIIMFDEYGQINFWNLEASRLFGYESEDILSQNIRILFSSDNLSEEYKQGIQLIQDVIDNKQLSKNVELFATHSDGKHLPVEMSMASVEINDETNVVCIVRDITERKKYERDLLKAKQVAEVSDRMKSAFLSTISHELRTPLNAIIGFAELMKMGNIEAEDLADFNNEILGSGMHLLSIVDDILDVSMLEKRDLKFEKSEFSVNLFMKEIYTKFKNSKRYENKAVELVMKVDVENSDPTSDQLNTDPVKLEHVFSKLIDNAYKFSEKGKIEFGYKRRNYKYEFYVKDQGIGIENEKLQLIFETFGQAVEDENRAHDGMGLGLSIVKLLLDIMGSEIRVESEVGKGSTFYFTIEN